MEDSTDGRKEGCRKGTSDEQSEDGSKGDVETSKGKGSSKGGCKKGSGDEQSEDGSKGDVESSKGKGSSN